jgi:membrane fusion protein (multidrug efflux system)
LAKVALRQDDIDVDRCSIESPFAGVVDRRRVELGEYVHEGTPVFEVVDTGQVKVEIDVPERDVGYIKVGMPVAFRIASVGWGARTGLVTYVAVRAEPGAGAFPMELTAQNEGGHLRPGMIADVDVVRRVIKKAVLVPLAAVIERQGDHIVFVAEGDRAVLKVVKLDVMAGSDVSVSSGLAFGDRVIIEGHRSLRDGALIEVTGTE